MFVVDAGVVVVFVVVVAIVVVVVIVVVIVVTDVFVEHRLSTEPTELPFPHQPRRLHILPYPVKKKYVAITIPDSGKFDVVVIVVVVVTDVHV